MCEDPILAHFNPKKRCFVKTDLSDYINAGMLSQMDDNSVLHLITYFSRRMAPANCNYKIYNKKFLAIICCFIEWRPELGDTGLLVKVLTDHKSLKYFMTTKKLTLRQVRWAEFLSEFNFVISYQSGKKNDKANALMRKPNQRLTYGENKRHKYSIQMLLPLSCIRPAELQPIEKSEGDN